MKDFFKSLAFRVLAAVAALLVGMMIYAASTGGVATIPETIVGAVVTPLQTLASGIAGGFNSFIGIFTDSGVLRKENEELQKQINELRENQVELDELRRQNERYRDYLALNERNSGFQFADAQVVAMDPSDNYYNFTVNVGSLDGVSEGNPVITPAGLVGVVSRAGASFSEVRTILDPTVQISAYVSRTRDNGITGNTASLAREGLLRLMRLDRGAGVAAGDMFVTFGGGNKYPAGLRIGEVTEVFAESDGLSMSAVVRPYADIAKLSDVFIITDFDGKDELSEP